LASRERQNKPPIQEKADGKAVDWMEQVSDGQYRK